MRRIYGKDRKYELAMITVKEDFDGAQLVKSDEPGGPANLPVFKLNLFQRIETDNYPYQLLTSCFVTRDDPRLFVKETHGSQEWCGNTFQEIVLSKEKTRDGAGRMELRWHSYWDGEADGERSFDIPANGLLEDALFITLRAAKLETGQEVPVRLFPSRISSKVGRPDWRDAVVVATGDETLEVGGEPIETQRIEVRHAAGARVDRFWIEKAFPRAVVRFEQPGLDGRSGMLKNRERYAYWR